MGPYKRSNSGFDFAEVNKVLAEALIKVGDQFWIDFPNFIMSSSRNAAIHKHLSVMPSIGRNLYN